MPDAEDRTVDAPGARAGHRDLRALLVLGILLGIGYVVAAHVALEVVVMEAFEALELNQARAAFDRGLAALNREIEDLDATCLHWVEDGAWGVPPHAGGGEGADPGLDEFFDHQVDFAARVTLGGKVLWRRFADYRTGTALHSAGFPEKKFPIGHTLVHGVSANRSLAGLYSTDLGVFVVSSRATFPPGGDRVADGLLVLGRRLDAAQVPRIGGGAGIRLALDPPTSPAGAGPRESPPAFSLEIVDQERALALGALTDLRGRPVATLRIEVPRGVTRAGREATAYSLILVAVAALVGLVLVGVALFGVSRLRRRGVLLAGENVRLQEALQHGKQLEQRLRVQEEELRALSARLMQDQEETSRRISRDIHDSLGQTLTAVKFRVEESLLRTLDAPQEDWRERFAGVVPAIQAAIEEARRICYDLRPPTLDDLGIVETVDWFCTEFRNTYRGISVQWEIEVEETQVEERLKPVVYRILQEALNNVAKHAGCTEVAVRFLQLGDELELSVTDNGGGFDGDARVGGPARPLGMGLSGMRERARLSGGELQIRARPGEGASIRVRWRVG